MNYFLFVLYSTAGVSASFGEMLLLVAMYFHSNQLSAIIDLVCSTLGMKIVIKPSSLSRMKTIFTQEIFTEQVCTLLTFHTTREQTFRIL
ncbi:hypothetical protein FKM82_017804 [Ascaphus truei]